MKCKIISVSHKPADWEKKALAYYLKQIENINMIIGGSYGISEELLAQADLSLSASHLTFPHRLFKILLMEQIYRASAINRNHPYHK